MLHARWVSLLPVLLVPPLAACTQTIDGGEDDDADTGAGPLVCGVEFAASGTQPADVTLVEADACTGTLNGSALTLDWGIAGTHTVRLSVDRDVNIEVAGQSGLEGSLDVVDNTTFEEAWASGIRDCDVTFGTIQADELDPQRYWFRGTAECVHADAPDAGPEGSLVFTGITGI